MGNLGRMARAATVVGAAAITVNLLALVVPLLAAALLAKDQVGALVTLLTVVADVSITGLGLQTALAVRWARIDASESLEGAKRVSLVTAGLTCGAVLVATPLLARFLHVPMIQVVLVAAIVAPVVLAGRWLGELQGRQRYGRLALGTLVLGIARYGGVTAGLITGQSLTVSLLIGAVVAMALVAVYPWLTGHSRSPASVALTGHSDSPASVAPTGHSDSPASVALTGHSDSPTSAGRTGERVTVREVLRACQASMVMLVISSIDLVLARVVLPAERSGVYAVGAVLTKGALWAPAVLTVLALPFFARGHRAAVRSTLALVAAGGVLIVTAAWLGGRAAARLVGASDYAEIAGSAPLFAAVGSIYAFVFVLVNAEIAQSMRRPGLVLWFALVAMGALVVITRPSDVDEMLVLALIVAVASAVATSASYAWRRRRQRMVSADAAGAIPAASAISSGTP